MQAGPLVRRKNGKEMVFCWAFVVFDWGFWMVYGCLGCKLQKYYCFEVIVMICMWCVRLVQSAEVIHWSLRTAYGESIFWGMGPNASKFCPKMPTKLWDFSFPRKQSQAPFILDVLLCSSFATLSICIKWDVSESNSEQQSHRKKPDEDVFFQWIC